jgi:pilus assembly protein Flp/PilA
MNNATISPRRPQHGGSCGRGVFRLVGNESGVTAIEYALVASLIAVAAIAAVTVAGTNLSSTFSAVASNL